MTEKLTKMRFYGVRDIDKMPELQRLSKDERFALKVVSHVLPFRTNNYVVEKLINWSDVPNDPIYQLTFMQKDMLDKDQFNAMADVLSGEPDKKQIELMATKIRNQLNPHPAGQTQLNVPNLEGNPVEGIQHKYKQTCLVFPTGGQTCFAYCTFCFRWAQFVETDEDKFVTDESRRFQNYLHENKQITDVLFTGGDPMIMTAKKFASYVEPLLGEGFEHIQNIRIGTKSLSFWPQKFTTDKDAENYLRLFEKIVNSGKHLALMSHFSHPIELSTETVQQAIKNIRNTGAEIRTQSPVLRNINDSAKVWTDMWNEQVRQACIPYYMFMERDTGAKKYFEIPIVKALGIYKEAIQGVSGLARTARGPSMSATPGKVCVDGIATIKGEKVFVLSFLQGRNSNWVKQPFFAQYDEKATWFNELRPAFGEEKFFFEK